MGEYKLLIKRLENIYLELLKTNIRKNTIKISVVSKITQQFISISYNPLSKELFTYQLKQFSKIYPEFASLYTELILFFDQLKTKKILNKIHNFIQ